MPNDSTKRLIASNKAREEIAEAVAKEMGLPKKLTSLICNSQFEFLARTMRKGMYEKVRFAYLGRFEVNPYRLKKINENYAKIANARQRDLSGRDSSGNETS